jgi:hypothetical protein
MVRIQVAQIPDQQAPAVCKTFAACEKQIVVDVHCSNFIFVAFQSAFDVQCDQIPDGDVLLTGSEHQSPFRVDHNVLDETSQMRTGEIGDDFAGLKVPNFETFGSSGDEDIGVGSHGEDGTVVGVDFTETFPLVDRVIEGIFEVLNFLFVGVFDNN